MLEHYIAVGQQAMRCGYTTGTCAAAAARAAAEALLTGTFPAQVTIETPAGVAVTVEPEDCTCSAGSASCAVRKDGGDDIDVTHGAKIFAAVTRIPAGIEIDGGDGVGRVTKAGLDQPVGAAAINTGPRRMIEKELTEALRGHGGGLRAVISVPEGAALAQKTFNPRLGIVGGISILGSTGIVRPMSRQALVDTTRAELSVRRSEGVADLLLTPGNYGDAFARETLGLDMAKAVQCSNYIGAALDDAVRLGFSSVLLVGHLGKLTKLAAGITDTHSRTADGRREVFVTHAALAWARRWRFYKSSTKPPPPTPLWRSYRRRGCWSRCSLPSPRPWGRPSPTAPRRTLETGAILFSQAAGVSVMTDHAPQLLAKQRTCSTRRCGTGGRIKAAPTAHAGGGA